MITVQEIIETLENKIHDYRQTQSIAKRIKVCLQAGQQQLKQSQLKIPSCIQKQMEQLKQQASERISAVGAFCSNLLTKQRSAHEEQIDQLRNQMSRQYKVINLLKQQLEDLMLMINVQKSDEEPNPTQAYTRQQQNIEQSSHSQTINGLEVIEEQETDRTLISSYHSINQEPRFTNSQNFIKIQEKGKGDFSDNQSHQQQSQILNTEQKYWQERHEEQDFSHCKFQQLLQSQVSKRQLTLQYQQCSQEYPSQWESMPLSAEVGPATEPIWQTPSSETQLRQITNQTNENVQKERQSKTKMFLEEFRKTFNKCLSSAHVSRKSSKNMSRPPKDKSKAMTTTFGKLDTENHQSHNNQKMITDMLKDLDNNNKFSVGNRRSELRYQGQKRQGVRSGQGVLFYSNGLTYEGQFKNNQRYGFGVLKFNQIQIYKGQWIADQLSGQGKIRNFAVINKRKSQVTASPLSRWVSYCGSFRGNRFEGQGTLYLQGGQKFLGRFICGSACGEGTLYKKNGQVQTGVWRHNQLVQQF